MLDDDLDPDFDDDDQPPAIADANTGGADTPAPTPLPAEPKFASVYRFVNDHLVDQYRRDVTGQRLIWCPRWWAHGEAVSRLEALWRAWEHLRLDGGTGMAVWWKDYADPTMAVLFDPQGPFAGCSADRGHKPRLAPLPVEPMPDYVVEWLMSDPSRRPEPAAAH
ncbi:DUF4913 domain-containing protein [uncultured Williamsia sp.]|uniref:DUF4913 domain-containing protein n=1 Tax=uncultured Williamsia sp. TaxID=259311 RepID=UPI00261EFCAE|nr:DUF4913 domain-containing protein [uncultured Williamsia sp.]